MTQPFHFVAERKVHIEFSISRRYNQISHQKFKSQTRYLYLASNYEKCIWKATCVIILGSMNNGNRSTANSERDVNALAAVRSPPSKVNVPNEITITRTGILFSTKLFVYKFTNDSPINRQLENGKKQNQT